MIRNFIFNIKCNNTTTANITDRKKTYTISTIMSEQIVIEFVKMRFLAEIKSYFDGDRVGNGGRCNNSIICCCSFAEDGTV
jgi:hypothetical protein